MKNLQHLLNQLNIESNVGLVGLTEIYLGINISYNQLIVDGNLTKNNIREQSNESEFLSEIIELHEEFPF